MYKNINRQRNEVNKSSLWYQASAFCKSTTWVDDGKQIASYSSKLADQYQHVIKKPSFGN